MPDYTFTFQGKPVTISVNQESGEVSVAGGSRGAPGLKGDQGDVGPRGEPGPQGAGGNSVDIQSTTSDSDGTTVTLAQYTPSGTLISGTEERFTILRGVPGPPINVEVTERGDGTTVTIGDRTFNVRDGSSGRDGQAGGQGSPGLPAPAPEVQPPGTRLPVKSPVAELLYQGVFSLSGDNSATFISENNGTSFEPTRLTDTYDIRQVRDGEVEAIRRSTQVTVTPRANGTVTMSPSDIAGDDTLTVITDFDPNPPATNTVETTYTNWIVWWPDINGINKDSNAQIIAQYTVIVREPPPDQEEIDDTTPIQRYAEVIRPVEDLDFYNVTGETSVYPTRNELAFEAQAIVDDQEGNEILLRKIIGITPVRTDGSFRFTGTDSEFTVTGPVTDGNTKTTTVRWYPRISGHAAYNLESIARLRFITVPIRYKSTVDINTVVFRQGGTEQRRLPSQGSRTITFQVYELQHGGTRFISRVRQTLRVTPNFTSGLITTSGATVNVETVNLYPTVFHTITFTATFAGQQFNAVVQVDVIATLPTPRNLQSREVLT